MEIKNKFDIGDTVYLHTDEEQLPNMVTGFTVRPRGLIAYIISYCGSETNVYGFEITANKRY
jgi:hypothetical protein